MGIPAAGRSGGHACRPVPMKIGVIRLHGLRRPQLSWGVFAAIVNAKRRKIQRSSSK